MILLELKDLNGYLSRENQNKKQTPFAKEILNHGIEQYFSKLKAKRC